jgi:predicted PurR-regulated permease PerM
MPEQKKIIMDISIMTIIKFFMVLLSLVFLYVIGDVIAILFVAIIFAAALSPWVDALEKRKVPRGLSVIFFFLIFIGFISLIVTLLVPPITEQAEAFAANVPEYSQQANEFLDKASIISTDLGFFSEFEEATKWIEGTLKDTVKPVFATIFDVFGGVVAFFGILVITFYLLIEENAIRRTSRFIVPDKYQHFFTQMVTKMQTKISAWLKGQFILSFLIGVMVYVSLLILGVEYALILALVAFIGEFVPYLGPMLAALPAIFVAFVQSPLLALFVIVIFIIIQQAENHILVPKIMQRAVGLNPVISIIAILIGFKLAGILGIVLAIPVATAVSVIIKEIYTLQQMEEPIVEPEEAVL